MTKAIDECPVCHSKDLKQKLKSTTRHSNIIGGPHTSSPPRLDGCSCNNCGTILKFNKKGKCPICKGTGEMKYEHYEHLQLTRTTSEKCWGCEGTGELK